MPRKLILDVDTGTDDAIAVMLAALHPDLELLACTTVNGNVEVHHCTENTLRVLDAIGRSDIPVYEGQAKPFARPDFPIPRKDEVLAKKIHPAVLPVPATARQKAEKGAVEFLVETYRAATDEITLVAVGPLTNIAAALTLDPGFAARVPEIVIMGGGHEIGNITPAAEFNVWCDPEAAAVVFQAGFKRMTLVPLDATHRALIGRDHCRRMAALGTPAGTAAAACIGHRIEVHDEIQPMDIPGTAPVHDALCVGFLVEPALIATRYFHVAVETQGALTVGRTVIDTHHRGTGTPNCHVAFDADAARFGELLIEVLGRR